ncbi:hypothetical protein CANCADRAFT_1342 [Tortispora caseinolytica NRRL Y-17796]|uniref:Valine--tRNA ligase, mitochondrial n=1 Tax=Tortispora caseinolytica NRRL Y-17796 TaxID=767744 RepID=A0A1E4TM71_9ASCO|nr:hypothetical protein CANCADRAFT_1342 [Tortispora caseinolytica NRRL Y-17796]
MASTEQPRQKTEKELEKERKKAAKLAAYEAKQAKKAAAEKTRQDAGDKPGKKAKKIQEIVPEYIDPTVPGEKKELPSLDHPALKAYNPQIVESSWYAWWESQGFFQPKRQPDGSASPKGTFVIPAPPPNVTGALHIGHALTVAIQDTLIRFNRMKGKTTLFIPGFDHAGISTQSVVEKMLWKKEQKTRHDLGREAFTNLVWEWKNEYHDRIKNQLKRLGASYDWSREAFTLDDIRSKAVRECFVALHREGIIYRANRLVNWCVHLNTALSNLEVDNKEIPGRTAISVPGYTEKVEFGVITSFAYPVEGTDEKIIVATTRPETLFGDTAVAVHPDDPRYKHLHGKYVVHPFVDRKLPIVTDSEAVDMEFGTGAVKITPAHDPNDYATGKRHNLEFINILNDDGTLNSACGPEWNGMKRFDARVAVIEQLKQKGLFIEQKDNAMSIPLCAKSGDVIEPIMKPQWWVRQKDMADAALEAVRSGKITITPSASEQEFYHWLSNIQDWCISRQLWWGHRCPVYFVDFEGVDQDPNDGKWWVSAFSIEEADEIVQKDFAEAKSCKYTLSQDEDVLDTWFSSGLWPFSTLGWPSETSDMKDYYPMNVLETGWDILFFWVARMVMLGIKMTGQVPFTEVFCHSLVRDAQGRKMSKSLGNVIDPLDVIKGISLEALGEQLTKGNLDAREIAKAKEGQKLSFPKGIPECGTDAMRFALCAYTTGGRDINLDILRVEGYRKFCNKIYQASKFALMRLGEGYIPPSGGIKLTGQESLVEKWMLHKLTVCAKTMSTALDGRDFLESTTAIYNYWLYELCDVYIENSKFLILDGTEEQKRSAQDTLYNALDAGLKMIHPFMPYITEELWQRLPRRPDDNTPSIVVSDYPEYDETLFDPESEQAYEFVLSVVKGGRSLISQFGILSNVRIFVQCADAKLADIIKQQTASIQSLVKWCESVTVLSGSDAQPEGCAVYTVNADCNVLVEVKGKVDFETEIKKAENKVEKAKQGKANLVKAISVKDYETKVKKEVQESNLKKIEQFDAEIENLRQMIAEFERLNV